MLLQITDAASQQGQMDVYALFTLRTEMTGQHRGKGI